MLIFIYNFLITITCYNVSPTPAYRLGSHSRVCHTRGSHYRVYHHHLVRHAVQTLRTGHRIVDRSLHRPDDNQSTTMRLLQPKVSYHNSKV